jgi:hypothetical protein
MGRYFSGLAQVSRILFQWHNWKIKRDTFVDIIEQGIFFCFVKRWSQKFEWKIVKVPSTKASF